MTKRWSRHLISSVLGQALSACGAEGQGVEVENPLTDPESGPPAGNPAQAGTPGGGSGGAIYNDGNAMTLSLCGTRIEHNEVVQHGSAIFFVSNDRSGDVRIESSVITDNEGGSWYPTQPQISGHPETPIEVVDSVIE